MLDPMLFPVTPPVGLDLRLPWKAPILTGAEKLPPCVLSPVPTITHPLALVQQLRQHQQQLLTSERLASERLASERLASERLASERLASERIASERLASERLASERLASERLASERLASERLASERLASERLASERLASERLASERLASERLASERLASERLASERLTSDVILPKAPPSLPMTSPLPALPAPTAMRGVLPMPTMGTAGGLVEERLGAGAPPPGISPLLMSESHTVGTSPYGRKLFPCPQCRYTTDRRNNLKRHMLTMHQLSAKLLECCGLLFRTKAALREHALIFHYHGYTCFYCTRRFCRKALLKRHLSVHNGQKEFLCNVCDYATSHKSNLERHRRVHVRQDGDDVTSDDLRQDEVEPLSDDVKSNLSETNSNVDLSCDELSVCSEDEDEEINVHSD